MNEKSIYGIKELMKAEFAKESLSKGAYSAKELLEELFYNSPKDYKVKIIINDNVYNSSFIAESWRGSYNLPAIGYTEDNNYEITVKEAIQNLETLDGKEVEGWKGGDFILSLSDPVFIANVGESNDCTAIIGYNVDKESETLFLLTAQYMY